jgi:hypothetical protein
MRLAVDRDLEAAATARCLTGLQQGGPTDQGEGRTHAACDQPPTIRRLCRCWLPPLGQVHVAQPCWLLPLPA